MLFRKSVLAERGEQTARGTYFPEEFLQQVEPSDFEQGDERKRT